MKRLQNTISYDCQNDEPYPEHSIYEYNNEDLHEKIDRETSLYIPKKKFRFAARVDLITENTVWEIKTTSELTIDHKLQLIIYAWLWEMRPQQEEKIFRLYNIKNNHLLRLNANLEELNEVIKKILKCRYISGETKSDVEFVKGCKR
jgi:CMP-N-acetylneuraminic acid synthetase